MLRKIGINTLVPMVRYWAICALNITAIFARTRLFIMRNRRLFRQLWQIHPVRYCFCDFKAGIFVSSKPVNNFLKSRFHVLSFWVNIRVYVIMPIAPFGACQSLHLLLLSRQRRLSCGSCFTAGAVFLYESAFCYCYRIRLNFA